MNLFWLMLTTKFHPLLVQYDFSHLKLSKVLPLDTRQAFRVSVCAVKPYCMCDRNALGGGGKEVKHFLLPLVYALFNNIGVLKWRVSFFWSFFSLLKMSASSKLLKLS